MRYMLIFLVAIGCLGCQNNTNNSSKNLAKSVDSLEKQLSQQYKPGLGTLMKHVQTHHAKLWFAGSNENWALADFEIHELKERFEAIEKYHAGNDEIEPIDMIYPSLDSVSQAVDQKHQAKFENSFSVLNKTCNSCHDATDHGFVKVKTPEEPPFSNQQYQPE